MKLTYYLYTKILIIQKYNFYQKKTQNEEDLPVRQIFFLAATWCIYVCRVCKKTIIRMSHYNIENNLKKKILALIPDDSDSHKILKLKFSCPWVNLTRENRH